ncbi:MAG: carbamoyltransferase HypF, partial [Candidatus Zixiibacteriota bacterium]
MYSEGKQIGGTTHAKRRRLRVFFAGRVQGVGFRPAAYRLARDLELGGAVWNDPSGAVVEIEGNTEAVEEFLARLPGVLPAIASIESVRFEEMEPSGSWDFEVLESRVGTSARGSLPPDTALCPDCRRELEDPEDPRFRYPFITCSNCGPRFSIVRYLPYDRERTSMACFPLCEYCASQYRDPSDRRFHAEPLSCPSCGPHLFFVEAGSAVASVLRPDASGGLQVSSAGRNYQEVIARAKHMLSRGGVVAVKGL